MGYRGMLRRLLLSRYASCFGLGFGGFGDSGFVERVGFAVVLHIDAVGAIVLRRVGALQRRDNEITFEVGFIAVFANLNQSTNYGGT